MSTVDRTTHAAADRPAGRSRRWMPRRARLSLGAAIASGSLAAAAALAAAAPAGAAVTQAASAVRQSFSVPLQPMPSGSVTPLILPPGEPQAMILVNMSGLTPGSSHAVGLFEPGDQLVAEFPDITASSTGQVSSQPLSAPIPFSLNLKGDYVAVFDGATVGGGSGGLLAKTGPFANTAPYPLTAFEVSPVTGRLFGPPSGQARIVYSPSARTLTVTVTAAGLDPGDHAAEIGQGSCASQGPEPKYLLKRDLAAGGQGSVNQTEVIIGVRAPVPASGWYLMIHQGSSAAIVSGGQPAISFRPELCADL
jgi:hypothetical protein